MQRIQLLLTLITQTNIQTVSDLYAFNLCASYKERIRTEEWLDRSSICYGCLATGEYLKFTVFNFIQSAILT
jgi:hypothetical protein